MERKIIFKDGDEELVLPVTPPSFQLSEGISIETVNITSLGDVIFGGNPTIGSFNIESFFPAQDYDFAQRIAEPYSYVNWFIDRCWRKKVLRFIVAGTSINIGVMIGNIDYGEKDGSGDVYYTLTVHRHKEVGGLYDLAESAAVPSGESVRPDDKNESGEIKSYIVRDGDCLWSIAQAEYGDGNGLWEKLKKYNGFTSTIIYTGGTVLLPPKSVLEQVTL